MPSVTLIQMLAPATASDESAMIANELKGVRELYAKNLVQLTRLSALEEQFRRDYRRRLAQPLALPAADHVVAARFERLP